MKVLQPDMPTADELLPFLRQIDEARWYSNHGPLVQRLESDLSLLLAGAPTTVLSNGTVALELALRALRLPAGANVLVPACTFRATGMAILNAGLTPVLGDVAEQGWQLAVPQALAYGHFRRIDAVVPVATFGQAVIVKPWDDFAAAHGVPGIIDAAGALLGQAVPGHEHAAAVFSLHATKSIGAGEGGVVASRNRELVDTVARMANFGYGGDEVGTNAKLSEYHAAVALASLAKTRAKVRRSLELEGWYRRHLPPRVGMQGGAQTCRTLLPVLMPDWHSATTARGLLHDAGIETKDWYAPFLCTLPQFAACPRLGEMKFTTQLQVRLLGLPFHPHLTEDDVRRVCELLARSIDL